MGCRVFGQWCVIRAVLKLNENTCSHLTAEAHRLMVCTGLQYYQSYYYSTNLNTKMRFDNSFQPWSAVLDFPRALHSQSPRLDLDLLECSSSLNRLKSFDFQNQILGNLGC